MRSNLVRRVVRAAIVAALLSGLIVVGQQSKDVPQAPVPSQIATAKKIFISHAGAVGDPRLDDGVYDRFYAAMKSWGRYELLAAPADADLIMEVVPSLGTSTGEFPALRLAILDPNKHVVLWTFNELVEVHVGLNPFTGPNRALAKMQAALYAGFDRAAAKMVNNVKDLDARAKAPESGQK